MSEPLEKPKVAVIVPIRNEADFIEPCLRSILANDYPRDRTEVLVVDGMSEDGTRDIVRRLAAGDTRLRLLDNPERIVPHAMNRGIRESKGDLVLRIDGHVVVAADYIEKCIEVLNRTGADNVGGYLTTVSEGTPEGLAIVAATSSPFGIGGRTFRTAGPEREADTVPFGCFRRDVFVRFGMFDERLVRNQDIELNCRICRGGGKIVLSPEIRLTYFNRCTFAGLRQQAYRNGLWNLYTLYLVGGGLRLRHFAPLGLVLSLLALMVGGLAWWPLWMILVAEVGLYLMLGAGASIRAARLGGANWAPVLKAIIQLHLSYGIGSLWGLVTAPIKFRGSGRHEHPPAFPDRKK